MTIFFSIIYDFKLNCTVNTGWKIIFLRITALLSLPLFFLLFCCENDVYALAYLRIGSYAPGSLCNVSFPMASFTCIVTSQVFVEIWMRWSIALSSAFYTGRKHLWIVFSFNIYWHSTHYTSSTGAVIFILVLKPDLKARELFCSPVVRVSICEFYHLFQSLWANFNQSYLHFIRNARLKSIRSSDWYLPITARPNHFWRRNIRTTFFHRNIAQLYQFTHLSWVYLRVENCIKSKWTAVI